jgi:GNAT superfamily N-acetyltransferase
MHQVARDEITDINEAVGHRWRSIDPLLPDPADLPEGCPLLATQKTTQKTTHKTAQSNGRLTGLAACRHQHVPADSLAQTWDAATKFTLTMRLADPDTQAAADDLLTQWRAHLAGLQEAKADDTSASVTWPSRDVTGVLALLRHGLQPITVIAVRTPGRRPSRAHHEPEDLVIRHPTPADLDTVTDMELGVIHYDAHFGASIPRPATPTLVKEATRQALERRPDWTWLATQGEKPVGLAVVEPPDEATWIAGMTRPGQTAYLSDMYLKPDERGRGTGAELVRHVHDALDARGIDLTLLHYAQLNPLSAPFWHRMGYRPLWSIWAARPATTLR